MPKQPPLAKEEAALRIAMVLVHADGEESPPETEAVASVLGDRVPDPAKLEAMVEKAYEQTLDSDAEAILRGVGDVFPDKAGRQWALDVACRIALADHRLRMPESKRLARLADALGLPPAAVAKAVEAHWPQKDRKAIAKSAKAAKAAKP